MASKQETDFGHEADEQIPVLESNTTPSNTTPSNKPELSSKQVPLSSSSDEGKSSSGVMGLTEALGSIKRFVSSEKSNKNEQNNNAAQGWYTLHKLP